jgi:hypothetical protein
MLTAGSSYLVTGEFPNSLVVALVLFVADLLVFGQLDFLEIP